MLSNGLEDVGLHPMVQSSFAAQYQDPDAFNVLELWKVQGSFPGSGSFVRQSPKTPTHFIGLEGVRLHSRVQNSFWTESQDLNAFQFDWRV